MSEFVIGIPIGIAIGLAVGLNLGRKLKPWSELTTEEKKQRKTVIGLGCTICIIGLVVFFWQLF